MIPGIRKLARDAPTATMTIVFILVVLYPIIRFLFIPWFPGLGPIGGSYAAVSFPFAALINSVQIGLACTLLALPIGLGFAWLFERRCWKGDGALLLALWLVFVTPSYLLTTGWQIVFTQPEIAGGLLAHLFFGEAGIVFLLGLKGVPFATLAARTSWRALGAELTDAARLLIRRPFARCVASLQLLLPSVGAAFAVVFIETIQEFGVPATLGAQIHLPIVTYAIYERLATTPVDFKGAAELSCLLVGLALAVAVFHQWLASRYSGALVHGRRRAPRRSPCSRWEALAAWGALAVLAALGLVVPGTAIVVAAIRPVGRLLPIPWMSLADSAVYAILAAILAVVVVLPLLVRRSARLGWFAAAADAASLGNMAIPGVVLGAAFAIAFNGGGLSLYGSPLLLIIAYVAVQVPMLMRFLRAPIDHLHHNLSDAARVHGLPWLTRIFDIDAPLLGPAIFWGGMMAFGQVFFELPISELLYPPGRPPVAVGLVWLNQNLHYTEEARLALAGIAVTVLVSALMTVAASLALPSLRAGEFA